MELVGDAPGEVRPEAVGDQVEHHVHRRRPAGAGQPIPVDLVYLARAGELGEFLQEGGPVLPVDGAAVSRQQTGLREKIGSGRQRADVDAAAGRLAQDRGTGRSEEHTSELQSLMRISYAVSCLNKKINFNNSVKY